MRAATLLLVPLLLAGCLEPAGSPSASPEPVPFRSLLHQSNVPVVEGPYEGELDETEWDAAWAAHAGASMPAPARPPVDFSRERVVAVALGMHGSGCHDVKVENVTREGGTIVVSVSEFDGDGPGMACTAQVVSPVHIIAIEDDGSPLAFRHRIVEPPASWERPEVEGRELERLSLRPLDEGDPSGVAAAYQEVLRDEEAYADFWREHVRGRPDPPPAPPVEFPNESVVAVVLGERDDTCFGVRVDEAVYDSVARRLTVTVVEIIGGPGVRCVRALLHPFHVLAVPTREGEVVFHHIQRLAGSELEPAQPGPPPPDDGVSEGEYAFRTLSVGASSGIREPLRRVIGDEPAWRGFWEEHTSGMTPRPTLPSVDFEKERAFVALAGVKPNPCHAIRVDRIEVGADAILVNVTTWTPPADTMCAQALAQPHHFVSYPRDDRPHEVAETTRVGLAPG